jgi:hypothetical protein
VRILLVEDETSAARMLVKGLTEVQVSAIDGSIVAVEKEDLKKEAKEKAAEAKKK